MKKKQMVKLVKKFIKDSKWRSGEAVGRINGLAEAHRIIFALPEESSKKAILLAIRNSMDGPTI